MRLLFGDGMIFLNPLFPVYIDLYCNIQSKKRDDCLVPELPDDCPPILAEICHSCWEADPDLRPTFKMILKKISLWEKEQKQKEKADESSSDDESRNRADSVTEKGAKKNKQKR
jgi:hypothetical protein